MMLSSTLRTLAFVLVLTLTLALTPKEYGVIRDYSYKHAYDGVCHTRHGILVLRDWPQKAGHYLVYSTGVPNHPVHLTNPNRVQQQMHAYFIQKNQTLSGRRLCLPMGEIGFAVNGVPFFNPLTAEQINAVQGENSEQFDGCHGHPTRTGTYHYHKLPALDCLFPDSDPPNNGNGTLLGVALDGFPIYYWDPADHQMADFEDRLDECHGTSQFGETYRYYITDTFPYIIGCFKGTIAGRLYGQNRQFAECPGNFAGQKTTLCSCPRQTMMMRPTRQEQPPSRAPPQGIPPYRDFSPPPVFGEGLGEDRNAKLLAYNEITDSDCYFPYSCNREDNVPQRGCSTKRITPKDCNRTIALHCTGRNRRRPRTGQIGRQPQRDGQQPPQNGQQQPQNGRQMQYQQPNQNGQQSPNNRPPPASQGQGQSDNEQPSAGMPPPIDGQPPPRDGQPPPRGGGPAPRDGQDPPRNG